MFLIIQNVCSIFVDADQIVRTDLKELRDLDLGGAPYGYTPFCDSRKEMDGFRFWKSGYWKNHLQGKPFKKLTKNNLQTPLLICPFFLNIII